MITIFGPKSLTLPSALGGDDAIYGLVVVCATRGLTVNEKQGSDTVSVHGIKDTGLVTLQIVQLLLSKGADVLGYPVFFEIDDVTALCPFSPDDAVDAEGDPIPQETWETWGVVGESHKPRLIDGKWYRSNNVGASGEPLDASKWASWIGSPPAGITVLSVDDYKALADSQELETA